MCGSFQALAEYEYRSATLEDDAGDASAAGRLIDVEILGHIFEQSIADLETMRRDIDAPPPEAKKEGPSRRKKEGAFYTPAFITRYIVQQTLGPVLAERFERIRAEHLAAAATDAVREVLADPSAYDGGTIKKTARRALVKFWEHWRDEVKTVRIVDPACGSGAFLIEAFDQLHAVYRGINSRLEELAGGAADLFALDRSILQENLHGVDLNGEAVEICQLSLWIKTAERGKPLANLEQTIQQGNSVVDDPAAPPSVRAFSWRTSFPEAFAAGGFDVVLGNPPYVRQEWISDLKPFLKRYKSYDGVADLYVYFYELGLNILKPGGRIGFIVTNKWMKAGYGENLRKLYSQVAWVEQVIDFGHAKQIFPEAEVFPCIVVVRNPNPNVPPPTTAKVCAIPREQLRIDDLSRQIVSEGFDVPLNRFNENPWSLEPPGVAALVGKMKRVGVPLKAFVGAGPLYGIKTGCNEAFVVDGPTRDRLVADDPRSAEILKKYLRGQDIDRWNSEWSGEWMIFARRGVSVNEYPAVRSHLERFRTQLEPKPKGWGDEKWEGRKPGSYLWYELQDAVDYWPSFEAPKIIYQDLATYPCFAFDRQGMYINNTAYCVPTSDLWILATLNSPIGWTFSFRVAQHAINETLRMFGTFIEAFPIPTPTEALRSSMESSVSRLLAITCEYQSGQREVLDWLRADFNIDKASQKLKALATMGADGFVAEVRKIRGKKAPLSVADVKRLKQEHAQSVVPLQTLAAEARQLERRVSDLVNAAYGLTPEEVALMWSTAPPRMPGEAPEVAR